MKKITLFILLFLSFASVMNGQTTANIGDYRTVASGSWHLLATWQTRTAANTWAAATVLPGSTNNVYIQAGHLITVNTADAICNGLNIFNNANALTISSTFNVNVYGRIRTYITAPAVIDLTDGATLYTGTSTNASLTAMIVTSSTGVLKFVGTSRNITNTGEWGSNGTTNNVEFALDASNTGILQEGIKFKNIIFSGGIVSAVAGAFISAGNAVGNALTIRSGAKLIIARTGSVAIAFSSSAKCTAVNIDDGGTLEVTGATPYMDCGAFVNNGTVIYSGTGATQTLLQPTIPALTTPGVAISQYDSLVLNGTGTNTKTATTNITVAGLLNVSTSTSTFDLAAFSLGGTLTSISNSGTIKTSNTSSTPIPSGKTWGGTINYSAPIGAQTIVAGNYNNLMVSNISGINTLASGTIGVAGNFSITNLPPTTGFTTTGNTVDFNGTGAQTVPAINYNNLTLSNTRTTNSITLSGNIAVAGTFSPNATFTSGNYVVTGSTINFNGAVAQTIPSFNYNNLTISGSYSTNNVTLSPTGTIGVAGTFLPSASFTTGGYVVTNSTVNFNNATGQTIPAFSYYNLTTTNTLSSSTLAASPSINIAGTFTSAGKYKLTPGTGTMVYAAGSTFAMNTSSNDTLFNNSPEWPISNGPANVNVLGNTLSFANNSSAKIISSYSLSGNVATIVTTTSHGFSNGTSVTITNVFPNDTLFNGTFTITSVTSTSFTFSLASPYTIPNETALGGNVTITPLNRKITGTLWLNGGGFNIGTGNNLIMANGSTIRRSSIVVGSQLTVNSGLYSIGEAATDLVNVLIDANGTVIGSSEMSSSPAPGGFGNLTITSTAIYNTSGARKIVNLINDGNLILAPTTTSTFTIYGLISGTGMITSGNNNASITIGTTATPSIAINTGDAGILRFNQTSPGTTNAFNNFKIERIPSPAGTPTVTFANDVSFKGNFNQSNGIVLLSPGATLTLSGTASSSGSSIRGNGLANISITGTGALGNLYFDQTTKGTTNAFNNFTLNRTTNGSATLESYTKINGTTTLTQGVLRIGSSDTLEIAGSLDNNSGAGTIAGGADSTTSSLPYLTVSGSGVTFNPIKFTPGFTEFKNVILSRNVELFNAADNELRIQGVLSMTGSSNTFTTNGKLVLRSTIAGTARVDKIPAGNQIAGDVSVQRYIPGTRRSWRLMAVTTSGNQTIYSAWQNGGIPGATQAGVGTWISSRLSNWSSLGFDGLSAGHSLLTYDSPTSSWVGASRTDTAIATDQGYMLFIRGDRTANTLTSLFTPTTLSTKGPLKVGNYPVSGSIAVNAGTFKVIGNPYASSIDIRNITKTNLDSAVYLWDPKRGSLGAWQTLTYSSAVNHYIIVPGTGSYGALGSNMDTIYSGQAFVVRASTTAGTVSFTENAKISGSANSVFRPAALNEQLVANLYLMSDSVGELADGTLSLYEDNASASIDANDARKMTNMTENFSISKNNTLLTVERTPILGIGDTVYFNMSKLKQKTYKIELVASNLNHPNLMGKLIDSYVGTTTPVELNGRTNYSFSVSTDSGSFKVDRFKLIFYQSGTLPVNSISLTAEGRNTKVDVEWKTDNQINIDHYEIERSFDSTHFMNVSRQFATGSNGQSICYNWLDEQAIKGNNYYRIKAVGKNGEVTYSNIVMVKLGKEKNGISIFPTIVHDSKVNVLLTDMPKGNYIVRCIAENGSMVSLQHWTHEGGSMLRTFNLNTKTIGNYHIEIMDQNKNKIVKTVLIAK